MITIDRTAPEWAHKLAQQILQEMENAWTRPLPQFTTTTLPDPTDAKWLWRLIAVTNGAGNKWVATTNGVAWRYLEGSAV